MAPKAVPLMSKCAASARHNPPRQESHYRKRVLCQQLRAVGEDSNPVGEGFPNRVSEFLLGKNRWRFK
jgi:hypothetical protein